MQSEGKTYYSHCCDEMSGHIADPSLPIEYVPYTREYGIQHLKSEGSMQRISLCPWCGSRLPASLREAWGEVLDEMGLYNPFTDDRDQVPGEFWSDTWWRKLDL